MSASPRPPAGIGQLITGAADFIKQRNDGLKMLDVGRAEREATSLISDALEEISKLPSDGIDEAWPQVEKVFRGPFDALMKKYPEIDNEIKNTSEAMWLNATLEKNKISAGVLGDETEIELGHIANDLTGRMVSLGEGHFNITISEFKSKVNEFVKAGNISRTDGDRVIFNYKNQLPKEYASFLVRTNPEKLEELLKKNDPILSPLTEDEKRQFARMAGESKRGKQIEKDELTNKVKRDAYNDFLYRIQFGGLQSMGNDGKPMTDEDGKPVLNIPPTINEIQQLHKVGIPDGQGGIVEDSHGNPIKINKQQAINLSRELSAKSKQRAKDGEHLSRAGKVANGESISQPHNEGYRGDVDVSYLLIREAMQNGEIDSLPSWVKDFADGVNLKDPDSIIKFQVDFVKKFKHVPEDMKSSILNGISNFTPGSGETIPGLRNSYDLLSELLAEDPSTFRRTFSSDLITQVENYRTAIIPTYIGQNTTKSNTEYKNVAAQHTRERFLVEGTDGDDQMNQNINLNIFDIRNDLHTMITKLADTGKVWWRGGNEPSIGGPLRIFAYDYFVQKYKEAGGGELNADRIDDLVAMTKDKLSTLGIRESRHDPHRATMFHPDVFYDPKEWRKTLTSDLTSYFDNFLTSMPREHEDYDVILEASQILKEKGIDGLKFNLVATETTMSNYVRHKDGTQSFYPRYHIVIYGTKKGWWGGTSRTATIKRLEDSVDHEWHAEPKTVDDDEDAQDD